MSDLKKRMKGSLSISLNATSPKDDGQRPDVITKLNTPLLQTTQQGMPMALEGESPLLNDAYHREYMTGEFLGEGGAAVVKKATNKKTGAQYACKIMRNWDKEKEMTNRQEFELL